jgi:hypothetical protein
MNDDDREREKERQTDRQCGLHARKQAKEKEEQGKADDEHGKHKAFIF